MTEAATDLPKPLHVEFCGISMNSPIVLLSGCVGFGEEYTRVDGYSNTDAGAIVLKGTTGEMRLGNKPHRVYETPQGMLNAIGLQNPGVDKVVDDILPGLDFSETRFFANVSGSTIEEYAHVTKRFDDSPIDAIEINISCPNVREGGVQFGNDPEMSARVVAACRAETSKPIIAKLSPNQTDIQENARLCIEAGTDGFAVINTIMGMAIDAETRTPIIGNVREARGISVASSVNLFVSDGQQIFAVRFCFDFGRYATDDPGKVHEANLTYLSLWYTSGREYGFYDEEWQMVGGAAAANSVMVASEPLTSDINKWLEVPEYSALHTERRNGHTITDIHYLNV